MYGEVRHEALSKCYIIRTLNCTYFRVLATFCVKEARDGTIQVGRGPVNVKNLDLSQRQWKATGESRQETDRIYALRSSHWLWYEKQI